MVNLVRGGSDDDEGSAAGTRAVPSRWYATSDRRAEPELVPLHCASQASTSIGVVFAPVCGQENVAGHIGVERSDVPSRLDADALIAGIEDAPGHIDEAFATWAAELHHAVQRLAGRHLRRLGCHVRGGCRLDQQRRDNHPIVVTRPAHDHLGELKELVGSEILGATVHDCESHPSRSDRPEFGEWRSLIGRPSGIGRNCS
jgi:hypothetical protein